MKPCPVPGCPELVSSGRCPTHTRSRDRSDAWARGTAAHRGYDWTWTKLRNRYIQANPLCELCDRAGKTEVGMVVDHIRPLAQGGERLNAENLQTLCLSCHARKTKAELLG